MIRSMTAFARCERRTPAGVIAWELRTVNHRYLEVTMRMPESLRALELAAREKIGGYLSRGKVDCGLRFQPATVQASALSLNRPLAERLLELAGELEGLMGPGTGLRLADVMRFPGVIAEPEQDMEPIARDILEVLDATLRELIATREREGARTAEMIRTRLDAVAVQVRLVRARRPEVLARLRDKLVARLAELATGADPGRIEQEMVIAAQRLDVDEELDRLDAHLAEIAAVLERKEPVGRRLDFLMQELNRESNTLSSKSLDTETTRAAVELKVLIEQMREQIQNIE
ncbi:uncharacterized protein (TIGR00255 family) [Plasticicumulans lactativorans]|uniref:Uncharacterized protein (TIGR00255 family) n=1 Tax=Plasticicumulans lactativorans TaxID=1133106 RepID=A0A4V2SCQ4_9GAMM|nr:YicC/YloC family endoribonuclease [Plasticicumulans lactativorans]TCO80230.1 uncharacterized protein (TIGR00255 family) [Plasticicumulans lactativorans]